MKPYSNRQEFWNAQNEHGPMITLQKTWLRQKSFFVTKANDHLCWLANDLVITYEELLDECKWQDGTNCGIE